MNDNSVEFAKVKAFRLDPGKSSRDRESQLALDGEHMPYGPVEVRVWKSMASILSR